MHCYYWCFQRFMYRPGHLIGYNFQMFSSTSEGVDGVTFLTRPKVEGPCTCKHLNWYKLRKSKPLQGVNLRSKVKKVWSSSIQSHPFPEAMTHFLKTSMNSGSYLQETKGGIFDKLLTSCTICPQWNIHSLAGMPPQHILRSSDLGTYQWWAMGIGDIPAI